MQMVLVRHWCSYKVGPNDEKQIPQALMNFIAAWFCLQCFTRLAQSMTISLLELNTLAHAICAFFIYGLWWRKAQDVAEPFVLQGSSLNKLVALALIEQPRSIAKIPIYANAGRAGETKLDVQLQYLGEVETNTSQSPSTTPETVDRGSLLNAAVSER